MKTATRRAARPAAACAGLILAVAALVGTSLPAGAQRPRSVQNIAPVYEGFEKNPDGSFNLLFGYYNRNWEEEIDVPVGPDNNLEPGGPDRGQPAHFFPRRSHQRLLWGSSSY